MTIGHYPTPGQLKDEDTYFKIFTKRELAQFVIMLIPSAIAIKIAYDAVVLKAVFVFLAAFTTSFLCGGMLLIMKVKLPDKMYLLGNGVSIDYFLIRTIRRKVKKSHVYIKNKEERGMC